MATPTTKLGLQKPAGPESQDVDILNANSDRIDKVVGGYLVSTGVTPPDSDLYPGCLVYENGSTWIWMAVPNGSGGFNKHWVYSYADCFMDGAGAGVASSVTPVPANNGSKSNKNWVQKGGLTASGITPPVAGRYLVQLWADFDYNTTGTRLIGLIDTDGASAYFDGSYIAVSPTGSGANTIISHSFMHDTTAGHKYNLGIRQNSGITLAVKFVWGMILLEPA